MMAAVRALLLVMLGGAIGTALRYGLALAITGPTPHLTAFPWATLLVNAAGCFGIAVLSETIPDRDVLGVPARLVLGTGLFGGFTTYSAFNTEVLRLAERGESTRAALYLGATLVVCVAAGIAGFALGRSLRGPAAA